MILKLAAFNHLLSFSFFYSQVYNLKYSFIFQSTYQSICANKLLFHHQKRLKDLLQSHYLSAVIFLLFFRWNLLKLRNLQIYRKRWSSLGLDINLVCSFLSRIGSSSSTEPLTASHGSLDRSSFRHRPNFFSQLSGQTFYNNEYGHLSEEGFCDFFASHEASCPASSNV